MAKKKTKKKGKKKASKKASKRRTTRASGRRTAKRKTRRKAKKKARRTTLYSSKGKKLYAVRAADGTFKDIQSYKRAHAMDLRRKSAAEA